MMYERFLKAVENMAAHGATAKSKVVVALYEDEIDADTTVPCDGVGYDFVTDTVIIYPDQ